MAISWLLNSFNHPAGNLAFIATTLVGVWPIARSALRLMRSGSPFSIETLMSVAALAGSSVEVKVSARLLSIKSKTKLPSTPLAPQQQAVEEQESAGNKVVLLHDAVQLLGIISLRADAQGALAELRAPGINGVMLTGDNARAAAAIAAERGIDYRAGLLPADKVAAVSVLNTKQPVAMVGDGINDAPTMKAATLGIAMGSGSDVALETADAALTHNRLSGLAATIRLSRATHANIRQNVVLELKGIFLVTTLLRITGLLLASWQIQGLPR